MFLQPWRSRARSIYFAIRRVSKRVRRNETILDKYLCPDTKQHMIFCLVARNTSVSRNDAPEASGDYWLHCGGEWPISISLWSFSPPECWLFRKYDRFFNLLWFPRACCVPLLAFFCSCVPLLAFRVVVLPLCLLPFIIRAKRVSNCYMQEKKNWQSVCLSWRSVNLDFSVRSANRIRPKHGIPLSV